MYRCCILFVKIRMKLRSRTGPVTALTTRRTKPHSMTPTRYVRVAIYSIYTTRQLTAAQVNTSYVCYFDPTHLNSVTLSLPHRTLVIVVLVIASACMVLIPITICISACLLRGRSGGVTLARVSEEERRRERVPILHNDQD